MGNKYGLPEQAVERVRERDKLCVYCRKLMAKPNTGSWRGDWATIEHLNHLPPWDNPETIAICCGSCNSSRGNRPILEWFRSEYCRKHGISPSTVSEVVLEYIRKYEGFEG